MDPRVFILENLRKSYGTREVLRGFSGTFVAGRIAALVGSNGAGKTTLMRIAAGLQHADMGNLRGGSVLYFGGFDTLPVYGTARQLRNSLGLPSDRPDTRRLRTLSRGELQRLGLDIAFQLKSDVLLLDEPWTALEPDARESLNAELRLNGRNRIIVCSSHDVDEVARIADDVIFLGNGIGTWKRREDAPSPFDRETIIRYYRETKSPW